MEPDSRPLGLEAGPSASCCLVLRDRARSRIAGLRPARRLGHAGGPVGSRRRIGRRTAGGSRVRRHVRRRRLALFAKTSVPGVGGGQRAGDARAEIGGDDAGVGASTTSRCWRRCSACSCWRRRASSMLVFVAFELMSIPLYFLTGFEKGRDRGRRRAQVLPRRHRVVGGPALRVLVRLRRDRNDGDRRDRSALDARHPLLLARPRAGAGGRRIQDRRRAVPHVGAGHVRGGADAVRGVALGRAQGRRFHRRDSGCMSRARARRWRSGCRRSRRWPA